MLNTDVLNFKNPDVAKAYTATVQTDRQVHAASIYSGPLSDITLPMAEFMVKTGCDLIIAQQPAGKSVAATTQPADKVK